MLHTLNPVLWKRNGVLDPQVRSTLLTIARDFYKDQVQVPKSTKPPPTLHDILLVGSNAGYGWTRHSDVDVHLVVDFGEVSQDIDMVRDYLNSKRAIFNDQHNLKVHGFPVELYCQNVGEPLQSMGQYSLLHGKWITHPRHQEPADSHLVHAKAVRWKHAIQRALRAKGESRLSALNSVKERLKKYRQSGLAKHGEFGAENLCYKVLRNTGWVDRVYDAATETYDDEHSMK